MRLPLGVLAAALAAATPAVRPLAEDAAAILRDAPVIDLAVTTRFYRFPGEPEKRLAPEELGRGGIGAVMLGAGALTEEIDVRDPAASL